MDVNAKYSNPTFTKKDTCKLLFQYSLCNCMKFCVFYNFDRTSMREKQEIW